MSPRQELRAAISVADTMRALGRLQPVDEETKADIAALLGLEAAETAAMPAPPGIDWAWPEEAGDAVDELSEEVAEPDEVVDAGPPVASTLREAEPEPLTWPLSARTIDAEVSEEREPHMPHVPLLVPGWTRAVLSGAFATVRADDDGPLDVDVMIDTLARGEVIDRGLRRPWPTLRRGVQLLVDRGEGMVPFTLDQRRLIKQIRDVAGRDRAPARVFVGTPDRPVDDVDDAGPRWVPPAPGTVVVLLTDLGIGRPMLSLDPAGEDEWLAFAQRVRRAGCPLVAFVPYPQSRWPRPLREVMTILEWDRTTTAATVRARVGRAHDLDRL